MSKVPSGWSFEKLDRYIQILSGYAFKSEYFTNDKSFIPVIRIRDLLDGNIETFYKGEYDENYLVENGDILVGMDGDFHVTKWRSGKSLLNQRVCKITAKKEAFDDFLFHFLSKILPEINSLTASTTVKHLSTKDLSEYIGYLPPLDEQRKIAEILTSVDRVIELTSLEIDKLKDLKKGMMQELLTKGIGHTKFKDSPVGKIPESWEVTTCEDVCREICVGIVIKPSQYYRATGVPAFRSANIRENRINDKHFVYISNEDNEILRKSKVYEGDLLTVRTGYPGTTCIVSSRFSGSNCVDVIISRPKHDRVLSQFLCSWINSDYGKDQVLKYQGGLAQQHFNVGELKELLVPVPSIDEQKVIVAKLQSLEMLIANKELSNSKLGLVKKGLMNDLLTGKVRVKV